MEAKPSRSLELRPESSAAVQRRNIGARIALLSLCLLVSIFGALIYVGLTVGRDLQAARSVMSPDLGELTTNDLQSGRAHLRAAAEGLDDPVAQALGWVPVVSSNLDAIDGITGASIDAVGAAIELRGEVESLDLIESGRVDPAEFEQLTPLLERQIESLSTLATVATGSLSGALAPVVYDGVEETAATAAGLEEGLRNLRELLTVAPELLGADGPRSYLVLLVNNAELRGSGGVLTGIGILSLDNGRLGIREFSSVHDLEGRRPYFEVDAPAEYERRFATYKANTSLLLNTTFSADFPDVAEVSARIYKRLSDVQVDGVLQVDPHGLAALMKPGPEIVVAEGLTLDKDEVADFALSDAYGAFDSQTERREALLTIGRAVFANVLSEGSLDADSLERIGEAAAGGHLKFAPFHSAANQVLGASGALWDMAPPRGDDVMVTAQNFGGGERVGSKLDYWIDRGVSHECSIRQDGSGSCTTEVELRNETPRGLTRYVAGSPYGLLRSYVEIFVPGAGEVVAVDQDQAPVEFRSEPQAGRTSLGVYVELPAGKSTLLSARYELPAADSFSLDMTPQPLSNEADLDVSLQLPAGWLLVDGPTEAAGPNVEYEGRFDRRLHFEAVPDDRPGLSGQWARLKRFWTEPVW